MSNNNPFLRRCALTAVFGAVSMCFSLIHGHGGEKHDTAETAESELIDSLPPSQSAILDSLYATIQLDFAVVAPVFKKGCFDCHTTRTEFPWYYKLPIVKGIIDEDIAEAKKHMDMSDGFPFGGHGKPADDLVAIREELVDGEMPPAKYSIMHWRAKPSDTERDAVVAWVDRSLALLASAGVVPTEIAKGNESEHK